MSSEEQKRPGRTYRLREVRTIRRPLQDVFEYAADFANSAEWDPGVDTAEQVGTDPIGVGTRYRLVGNFGSSTIPMEYEVIDYEPPSRVVLSGKGNAFDALDTMTFESLEPGVTRLTYNADITLYNALRLLGPLLNGPMKRMGEKALNGLVEQLET